MYIRQKIRIITGLYFNKRVWFHCDTIFTSGLFNDMIAKSPSELVGVSLSQTLRLEIDSRLRSGDYRRESAKISKHRLKYRSIFDTMICLYSIFHTVYLFTNWDCFITTSCKYRWWLEAAWWIGKKDRLGWSQSILINHDRSC